MEKLTLKTEFFNKDTDDQHYEAILNMNEITKVIHMKKKFPHGWFAACGREITSHTAVVSFWSEVTCKNCKLKQLSYADFEKYSDVPDGITSESISLRL